MKTFREFVFLLTPQKRRVWLVLACILAVNVLGLALPWAVKIVIDEVWLKKNLSLLNEITAALLFIFFFKFAFGFISEYLINLIGEKVIRDLRQKLYVHVQRLSVPYIDRTPKGQISSGVMGDIDGIRNFLFGGAVDFVYSFFNILFILAVLFVVDWRLAAIPFLYLPVFAFTFYKLTPRLTEQHRLMRQKYAELTSHLHEIFSGIRVVAGFAKEDDEARKFRTKQNEIVEASMAGHKIGIGLWMMSEFITSLGLVTIIWFGTREVFAGRITVGTLMAFYSYVGMLFVPVVKVVIVNNYYQESVASMERVLRVLAEQPKVRERPDPIIVGRMRGDVKFDRVSFGYGPDKRVLFDVNLDVKEREVVALVGKSGAGKTTMINLLLRFYDPQEGAVFVDGHDLRDVELKSYRSQIAMVLQDDYLFNASIRENILYGTPGATQAKVIEAAQLAYAHSFISELPRGYETQIGERGIALSFGQRQRISIARALLRDPSLLILDEAMSAVDSETERKIIEDAYKNLMVGRTTFIIAHRLSAVVAADRIVVFENGRIIETGNHAGLLAKKGAYCRMWSQQTSQPVRESTCRPTCEYEGV